MSILSIFKGGKKAEANSSGKAKKAEDPNKPPPEPYRHVPKHTARDSLTLGPRGASGSGSRASSIRHSSSNFSQMRGSAVMSRNNSGLSNVTTIHRGNSYNSRFGPLGESSSGGPLGGPLGGEWTSTTDQRRSRSMLQAPVGSIREARGPSPLKHQESTKVSPSVSPEVSPELSPKSSGGISDSSSSSSQILELVPNRQSKSIVTFHPTTTEIESPAQTHDFMETDGYFPSPPQAFNLNGPSRPQPAMRHSGHIPKQNAPRRRPWETPSVKSPQVTTNPIKVDPAPVEAKRKRWTFHGKKSTPAAIAAH